MIFWICVILLIIGAIGMRINYDRCLNLEVLSFATLMVGVIGFVISCMMLIANFSNASGGMKANWMRYESLVYQLENDIYDNDNDIGKRELYKKIQEWNESLAWNKEAQDNFWIGIYNPNIYDEFNFIDLEEYAQETQPLMQ